MNPGRLMPWLIGGVMLLLVAGVGGWAIGAGAASGQSDAETARQEGYEDAFQAVFRESRRITAERGFKTGSARGRQAGATTGSREGSGIGAGNAKIEQAVASEKSEIGRAHV